ncbi:MAG: DUF1800 domain-containing protein [Thermoflexales bacterium]|nr:DUF1800 domain-containing protein [Thermoflexales bacterium]MDW8352543.1 DUF1800 domain-containing protein [Anaerolineae bacterium]
MSLLIPFSGNPPGGAPSLARLAWNRMAFGPRPEDIATFGSFDLIAFVDQQLDYESINDAACDAYLATMPNTAPDNSTVPPLDASLDALKSYVNNFDREVALKRYLWMATYARALLSKRQLFEVMVDFWTNHFHTDFPTDYTKYWEDYYVIRQHALGNFRDLLEASAKSPSMLQFLSNRYNDGSNPNENYARELLELHTVGSYSYVPGPGYRVQPNYTEEDVHKAARILSGWTNINSPNHEFYFNASRNWPRHDWTEKQLWLGNDDGYYFPYGGIEQGQQLLDILAEHPSTAYFIAFKLCRRFISDHPDSFCPDAIEDGAQAFLKSHGDIRQTVRAILLHPKFAQSWGQKIKRPFEFIASTMRAMGLTEMINLLPNQWHTNGPRDFERNISLLGQVLFQLTAPTGYPDIGVAWWNSNQVFGRWTLANMLVARFFGEQTSTTSAPSNALLQGVLGLPKTATEVVDLLIERFIGRTIHADDRAALISYLGNGNSNASIQSDSPRLRPLIGAVAASPYAQWR